MDLIEIIAEAMYEAREDGVWDELPEKIKELWRIDAGFVAEAIERKYER